MELISEGKSKKIYKTEKKEEILLYFKDDIADAKLLFERRIKDITRTLNFTGKAVPDAYIKAYGNTVVLYIMKDNDKYEKLMRDKL